MGTRSLGALGDYDFSMLLVDVVETESTLRKSCADDVNVQGTALGLAVSGSRGVTRSEQGSERVKELRCRCGWGRVIEYVACAPVPSS